MTKYQRRCPKCSNKMSRAYIRQYPRQRHMELNKPIYKTKWKAIGWICTSCDFFLKDN